MKSDVFIIDVRTAAEYAEGHLAGSELLDLSNGAFTNAVTGGDLDPDAQYLLYCRSGDRSPNGDTAHGAGRLHECAEPWLSRGGLPRHRHRDRVLTPGRSHSINRAAYRF